MSPPIHRHLAEAKAKLEYARGNLKPDNLGDTKAYADWRWNLEQAIKDCSLLLRETLEIIAYHRLLARYKYLNEHELNRWQPAKVIETLADLADEKIESDSVVRMKRQARPEVPASPGPADVEFRKRGVSAKEINKKYQRIGSLLHINVPDQSGDRIERIRDHDKAVKILEDVTQYAESFVGRADFHMVQSVRFKCDCGEHLVRREDTLNEGTIVSCPKPNCRLDYFVVREADQFRIELADQITQCNVCNKQNITIPIRDVAKMKNEYTRARDPLHARAEIVYPCPDTNCSGAAVLNMGITVDLIDRSK